MLHRFEILRFGSAQRPTIDGTAALATEQMASQFPIVLPPQLRPLVGGGRRAFWLGTSFCHFFMFCAVGASFGCVSSNFLSIANLPLCVIVHFVGYFGAENIIFYTMTSFNLKMALPPFFDVILFTQGLGREDMEGEED